MRFMALLSILVLTLPAAECQTPPKFGLQKKTGDVCPGYTLVSPLSAHRSFLLDNDGRVVHYWQADRKPGQASYLLEDGSLLRAGKVDEFFQFPAMAGSGGRIQKYSWDGKLLWDFVTSSPYRMSHHDLAPMPNGNVLCIVWESYLREVAEQAGRNPDRLLGDVLWLEAIFELKPKGLNGAEVVWRWSLKDHLVQDWDESKDNYGNPAEHPELVDINFMLRPVADWVHMNSVDYNPELDQILVSSRSLSEIWIIDHSTTTEEAKGHAGGKRGRGGDLLYRWGNPQAYRRGTEEDRMLFSQHDAQWIPPGRPGAGNLLVFNNGLAKSSQDYSSVDEIKLPLRSDGSYELRGDQAYRPEDVEWAYDEPGKLFSPRISGAQRLPNGNTLVCSGTQYLLQEVTTEGKVAWQYLNPPRFSRPPSTTKDRVKPSIADLPKAERDALRIELGIPLEDGGTMFKVRKYPVDYPGLPQVPMAPFQVPDLKDSAADQ